MGSSVRTAAPDSSGFSRAPLDHSISTNALPTSTVDVATSHGSGRALVARLLQTAYPTLRANQSEKYEPTLKRCTVSS